MVLNRLTSVQRIEVTNSRMGDQDVLTSVLQSDADKLRQTAEMVSRDDFKAAVAAIRNAKTIYILGAFAIVVRIQLFDFSAKDRAGITDTENRCISHSPNMRFQCRLIPGGIDLAGCNVLNVFGEGQRHVLGGGIRCAQMDGDGLGDKRNYGGGGIQCLVPPYYSVWGVTVYRRGGA